MKNGMMNILITGGTGLIGLQLRNYLSKQEDEDHNLLYNIFATRYENSRADGCDIFMDITNKHRVDFILNHSLEFTKKHKLNLIIHTAAMTDVDACEKYREHGKDSITNRAYQRNFYATKYLLDAMGKDCKFIFISTNYVFDGKNGPYSEDDRAENPVNYYGESKLEAERYVLASNKNTLVVRVSSPFIHSQKPCFPKVILEDISGFKKINAADDMITTPTYIEDICKGIELLLKNDANGIYHIAGDNTISMFDFAKMIALEFGYEQDRIEAKSGNHIFPDVKRPENSGLRNDKIKKFGFKGIPLERAVKMFVCDYRKAFK